jgi:hypothetical protein
MHGATITKTHEEYLEFIKKKNPHTFLRRTKYKCEVPLSVYSAEAAIF